MKFSIIVPIYNVEKYIDKCLKSIKNQSYSNYEVILVNDGTKDNSLKECEKYLSDKRFTLINQENMGLSEARNTGLKHVTGDYIIFLDSDDSIEKNLLLKLNEEIKTYKDIELIKYNVYEVKDIKMLTSNPEFHSINGYDAFNKLCNTSLFVTAWSYCYKKDFFINNNFKYSKGRIHEDFGLTPYIVIKSNHVSSINYVGYDYYIRDNSIMTSNSLDKIIKKNEDTLYLFDNMMNLINEDKTLDSKSKNLIKSYISYSLINRIKIQYKETYKDYKIELNKRKVGTYLINDTIPRKIKKFLYNYMFILYKIIFLK